MQDHFSREPPVYAKPKETQERPTSPASSNRYSAKPPPPLPGSQPQPVQQPGPPLNTPLLFTPSPQSPAQPTTDQPGRPALPPKPGTSSSRPMTVSPPQMQQPALPQIRNAPRVSPYRIYSFIHTMTSFLHSIHPPHPLVTHHLRITRECRCQ